MKTSVKENNKWVKGKVLQLWDPRSDSISQTGLVGDDTGVVKFTMAGPALSEQTRTLKSMLGLHPQYVRTKEHILGNYFCLFECFSSPIVIENEDQ